MGQRGRTPIPGINSAPLNLAYLVYILAEMAIHTIHIVTDFAYTIYDFLKPKGSVIYTVLHRRQHLYVKLRILHPYNSKIKLRSFMTTKWYDS